MSDLHLNVLNVLAPTIITAQKLHKLSSDLLAYTKEILNSIIIRVV